MRNKKHYARPCIKSIAIDKEISLALNSLDYEPAHGPNESSNQLPNGISNDPYKSQQS